MLMVDKTEERGSEQQWKIKVKRDGGEREREQSDGDLLNLKAT